MTVGETKVSGTPTCPRMAEVFVELPPIAFCNDSGIREVLVLSTVRRIGERASAANHCGLIGSNPVWRGMPGYIGKGAERSRR